MGTDSEQPPQPDSQTRHCSYKLVPAREHLFKGRTDGIQAPLEATADETATLLRKQRLKHGFLTTFAALAAFAGGYVCNEQPKYLPLPEKPAIEYSAPVKKEVRADLNNDGVPDIAFISDVYEDHMPTGQLQVIIMLSNPNSPNGTYPRVVRKRLPIQYTNLDSIEISEDARPDITLTSQLERTNPASEENHFGTLTLYNGADFNERF